MFKIIVLYDETIGLEDVPKAVVVMYINCGKSTVYSLDNHSI